MYPDTLFECSENNSFNDFKTLSCAVSMSTDQSNKNYVSLKASSALNFSLPALFSSSDGLSSSISLISSDIGSSERVVGDLRRSSALPLICRFRGVLSPAPEERYLETQFNCFCHNVLTQWMFVLRH